MLENLNLPFSIMYINNDILAISDKKIRKYFAVKTIWRYWFRAITNPEYTLCRNRLLKDLNNI